MITPIFFNRKQPFLDRNLFILMLFNYDFLKRYYFIILRARPWQSVRFEFKNKNWNLLTMSMFCNLFYVLEHIESGIFTKLWGEWKEAAAVPGLGDQYLSTSVTIAAHQHALVLSELWASWPWVSYFTSLISGLLICNVGIKPTLWS